MPTRRTPVVFLLIPFLLSAGSGNRSEFYEPAPPEPFTFFFSVQLKGSPAGLDSDVLARKIVQSLVEKAPTFELEPAGEAENPCATKPLCDRVTLIESIDEEENPSLQFVLKIKSGTNAHGDDTVPVKTELGCIWSVQEASNWRRCPQDNAERIVKELEKHFKEKHRQP